MTALPRFQFPHHPRLGKFSPRLLLLVNPPCPHTPLPARKTGDQEKGAKKDKKTRDFRSLELDLPILDHFSLSRQGFKSHLSHGQGQRELHGNRDSPPIPGISAEDRTPWFLVSHHRDRHGDLPRTDSLTGMRTMVGEILPAEPLLGQVYALSLSLIHFY